ncbi:dihydrolipoyl dehydrogenase [Altererythrobacter marinus]|uniref:Dihydrolipoyl dehydrogenase n=1 Tax=Pelagerythrobacter marinus TaxID=538382 RepID=A0ABW9UZ42_9SPHN|nr:dihydrolipoyl dehydrogenase [Pelagerythrobacter marinus]MXO68672.1 dihydrolipoyl dehydrogenase [Pelagerythrobacter marinus]
MARKNVEIAIIGAGTAGMRAYREVSAHTDSVLLIEAADFGTTCAREGCMPSKLLIAAAEAAWHGRHSDLFGVRFGEPDIDGRAVMKRVREERDRFVGFVLQAVDDWPDEHKACARAQFRSDHELELSDGTVVEAKRIIIATGSRPNIPPVFAGLGDRLITNADVFDWHDLPRSVAVFGAGVIGLELGQALHRLGVRTELFGRDGAVGPISDPEVAAQARHIFAAEFPFHADARVERVERSGDGVKVTHIVQGQEVATTFDYCLVATGRRPNVDNLGLENTSLELNERGIPLYDPLSGRCGDSHIFIAGDSVPELPLLHEAADEGFVAGYNATRFPEVRRFARSTPLGVVFSDPQIMIVGESHRDLVARGAEFETGSVDWQDQGRARVMGVNKGILHVYAERNTGRFLGAEMVGPRAEHFAHLLAWARQSELTIAQMLERPFYHPVLEEGLRTALRVLNYNLGMGAKPPPRCLDCGPGG